MSFFPLPLPSPSETQPCQFFNNEVGQTWQAGLQKKRESFYLDFSCKIYVKENRKSK